LIDSKQIFDIEITTHCNKQCSICPREKFRRQNREMSSDIFEKVCDWLPKGSDVFFAGFGEPLLRKNHLDFIKKLTENGIRSSIMTNGKLLSYDKICELYESGLYKLQISILLEQEEKEIKKFVDMIDGKFYKKTQFNLIYDKNTEKPINLKNELESFGFKVYDKRVHSRGGHLYRNEIEMDTRPCGTFERFAYIDTNGDLQICSNDINGEYNLGNILTLTFEELLDKKKSFNRENIRVCKFCDDKYAEINLQNSGKTL